MKVQAIAINLIIIVIMASSAQAAIITVGLDTGYDFGIIQAAIDIATDGDLILVADGLYTGPGNKDLDFGGRLITVRSENGPEETIIDCENEGRGFYFHSGETLGAHLRGFTIRGGNNRYGGGIYCSSNPVISNCIITENYSSSRGGGVYFEEGSTAVLENCLIQDNWGDWGGGINCHHSSPSIINCVITGNSSEGGGGLFSNYNDSTPKLINGIIWNNSPQQIYPYSSSVPVVEFSDIQGGWPGLGNIDAEPKFLGANNYRLASDSPCVDTGTNNPTGATLPTADLDGLTRSSDGDFDGNSVSDMGAYEFSPDEPLIILSTPVFDFVGFEGGANPNSQELLMFSYGAATDWQINESCPWLEVSPASGTCTNQATNVTLTVNIEGLNPGTYNTALSISSVNAMNSPIRVEVLLRVNGNRYVPTAKYPDIQSAINASTDGDVVIVKDGTYVGQYNKNLDFGGRLITLRSENGPQATIIDCENNGRGFYFHTGETSDACVEGFTICNGNSDGGLGGAILCRASSPVITNCIIKENYAYYHGGALWLSEGSNAKISNCVISDNYVNYNGGAFFCGPGSNVSILNCTITGNISSRVTGGIHCYDSGIAKVTNCILWNNPPEEISLDGGGSAIVNFCDIKGGWPGQGNIDITPLFMDPNSNDLRLRLGSPCIDTGIDAGVSHDIDGMARPIGAGVDMGAYEMPGFSMSPQVLELYTNTSITGSVTLQPVKGYNVSADVIVTDPCNTIDSYTNSLVFSDGGMTAQTLQVSSTSVFGDAILTIRDVNLESDLYDSQFPVYVRPRLLQPVLATGTDDPNNTSTLYFETVYPVDVPVPVDISVAVSGPVQLVYESGDEDIFGGQKSDIIRIVPTGQTGKAIIRFEVANYNQSEFSFLVNELKVFVSEHGMYHHFYVDSENGSDDNIGMDENNAFATIQKGIDVASNLDVIVVLPGTYIGDGNRDLDFHGKAITVRSLNGPENCIIDCQASNEDIHRAFNFQSGEDANSIVAGFTIINGNMYGMDGGGAIRCKGSSPTIQDCHINNNKGPKGGGIYLYNSDSMIIDCILNQNTTPSGIGRGGGIYCRKGNPKIKGCRISNNYGYQGGGGIYAQDSDVEITLCEIKSNSAGGNGTGIGLHGSGNPLVKDCFITSNITSAFQTRGGGVSVSCDATIQGCVIAQNKATLYGGGIYCYKSSPLIIGNIICENNAEVMGGGLYLRESTPRILNNVIANNIATGLHGYRVPDCTIANNTIIGNNFGNVKFQSPSTVDLINNIIANASSGPGIEAYDSEVVMYHNNVYGNPADNYRGLEDQTGINGNISVDPDISMIEIDNCRFHLLATSPCIDAGDPNTIVDVDELDINGESRIVHERIDIGADEFLDTDNDSLPDWWEDKFFSSIVTAHPKKDGDRDKLKNNEEYIYGTNPIENDIDRDGRDDAEEVDDGTDPYNVDNPERTYYVSVNDGNDLYDGLYQTITGPNHGPKKTIQATVDLASKGCNYIVLVADGTYTGEGNKEIHFDGKTIVLHSNDNDPNMTIIDCENEGRAFDLCGGETSDCRIEGFSIINGKWHDEGGGGIRLNHSDPTISNCILRENQSTFFTGGAISCSFSSPRILNCILRNNYANDFGGAIFCDVHSDALIQNCSIFENSTSRWGSAICLRYSSAKIVDCNISYNEGDGAGALACVSESYPVITGCKITNNNHSGIYLYGASPFIKNCDISLNYGAGLSFDQGCTGIVENCKITNNIYNGWGRGAGIHLTGSDVDIRNCTIADNWAQEYGGGIFARWSSNSNIINCILWGNSAPYGNQIAVSGDSPRLTVSYCDVEGGETFESIYREELYVVDWGYGNLEIDPLFVNSVDDDYRLTEDSPCIDAGADTEIHVDIEGNKRPFDYPDVDNNGDLPEYDMGAYELILPPMEVPVDVMPRVLNLSSSGKWFKVHFVLPEGFSIGDVDADIPVMLEPLSIASDYTNIFINDDGFVEVEATFGRSAFCGSVISDPTIEVTGTGLLISGQSFYGTNTIKIINYDSFEYLTDLAPYWLDESCSSPDWCEGFDLNHDSVVNLIDSVMFKGCCIEIIKK